MEQVNIPLNINDETSPLEVVILGIATDIGAIRYKNNPKEAEHVEKGTFPPEEALVREFGGFANVLIDHGITVYRPQNAPNMDQLFTRDIAFVIGSRLVKARMRKNNRRGEYAQIESIIDQVAPANLLTPPDEVALEGGDVILCHRYLFVGQSDRTNRAGFEYLRNTFTDREVIPLAVTVSDDPQTNVLHLDCAFQPVGPEFAILYEDGFIRRPDAIFDIFGQQNLIKVSAEEMYRMFPNVFSISPSIVVSDRSFLRLNKELRQRGLTVVELPFSEVAKLGGAFRCSTLPLRRTSLP